MLIAVRAQLTVVDGDQRVREVFWRRRLRAESGAPDIRSEESPKYTIDHPGHQAPSRAIARSTFDLNYRSRKARQSISLSHDPQKRLSCWFSFFRGCRLWLVLPSAQKRIRDRHLEQLKALRHLTSGACDLIVKLLSPKADKRDGFRHDTLPRLFAGGSATGLSATSAHGQAISRWSIYVTLKRAVSKTKS